ncbi:hypothetical protein WR25_22881 [Diploscapter pachys]|uniref:Uncharacterized protein n=1 Tax=Diploscapter pachys TaxID=2018661 RepID=A0A2A2KA99_9BILA|nr:hypothetical protein WR25_22881 [Diploscapter pachys]
MKELQKKNQVSLGELLNPQFISAHSSFANLESFFAASGFKAETPEEFAAIPDDKWDQFVAENTDFEGWAEMQKSAHEAYLLSQLHKGL